MLLGPRRCKVLDLDKAQFTNADMLAATGATLGTLQTWANRGLVDSSNPERPLGERRLYSALNAVGFKLMTHLTGIGISASLAHRIAMGIDFSRNRSGAGVVLVRPQRLDRGYGYQTHTLPEAAGDCGPVHLVIDVAAIQREVLGALETILEKRAATPVTRTYQENIGGLENNASIA